MAVGPREDFFLSVLSVVGDHGFELCEMSQSRSIAHCLLYGYKMPTKPRIAVLKGDCKAIPVNLSPVSVLFNLTIMQTVNGMCGVWLMILKSWLFLGCYPL